MQITSIPFTSTLNYSGTELCFPENSQIEVRYSICSCSIDQAILISMKPANLSNKLSDLLLNQEHDKLGT